MISVHQELIKGIKLVNVWKNLAWFDILQRYKRTSIGPLWGVITTGIIILFVGPVYSRLFGQKLEEYFPYVALSYILWNFISTLIQESANSLIASSEYIKHVSWPYPVYFYRCILRNLIVLSHNSIIAVPVLIYYSSVTIAGLGFFFIGLGIVIIMAIGFSMLMGLVCLRYRDIPQLITNFLNMLFFITPVFWSVGMLGDHKWIASINPMYHILEIVRQPLLGGQASIISYMVSVSIAFLLLFFGFMMYKNNRNKLAFWA